MTIAILPLAASAVGSYILFHHGVINSFQDVAIRQRTQVIPAQELRLLISNSLAPVDEYIEDGQSEHQQAYRSFRKQIETSFANLDAAMDGEVGHVLVQRARDEWTLADHLATQLLSTSSESRGSVTTETMRRFHGEIAAATDKLAAVTSSSRDLIEQDHEIAELFYERSLWLTGIAAAVSLSTVICGVLMIGRIMSASVDRLVDGAARFATGDRSHRIDVTVPPELQRVAEEFNNMIGRIHESEEALAELAHRDGLTGLANRRSFDEALPEFWARVQRFDEPGALLALDIDHFKNINDTYGHAAGDRVLQAIAKTLNENIRSFDKVFRVGGEEFAVLLPKSDREATRRTAERIRIAVESERIGYKGVEIHVTVSIGAASARDFLECRGLVEASDAALYSAKAGGRNRIIISDEAHLNSHNAA
jgi:diguanylate cyclase (GGDEF)-like protein